MTKRLLRGNYFGGVMQVGTPEPGRYKAVLSSDDIEFGGSGRIGHETEHFTHPEGTPGATFPPVLLHSLHHLLIPWKLHGSGLLKSIVSPCAWADESGRRYSLTGCHAWPAGVPESNFNDRAFSMMVAAPSRTVAVYALMPEEPQELPAS
jgi:hypothetical protein